MDLNINNFDESIRDGKVLVDFWAPWCGPCRMLTPIMDEIKNEGYNVYKVNVDDNHELAKKYGVMSIPCVIYFKDGKEINKIIGFTSKNEILKMLED
ncbi:MAG: thioredoxin [Bacilli bacterium]|nr:thioredoxin [Bacilli bacterium]